MTHNTNPQKSPNYKINPFFIFILLAALHFFHLESCAVQLLKEEPEYNTHFVSVRLSLISALKNVLVISGSWTAFRPFELNAGYFNAENGLELFSESYRKGYYFTGGFAIPWRNAFYSEENKHQRDILITAGYFYVQTLQKLIGEHGKAIVSGEGHAVTALAGLEITRWVNPILGLQLHVHLGANYFFSNRVQRKLEPALELAIGFSL